MRACSWNTEWSRSTNADLTCSTPSSASPRTAPLHSASQAAASITHGGRKGPGYISVQSGCFFLETSIIEAVGARFASGQQLHPMEADQRTRNGRVRPCQQRPRWHYPHLGSAIGNEAPDDLIVLRGQHGAGDVQQPASRR